MCMWCGAVSDSLEKFPRGISATGFTGWEPRRGVGVGGVARNRSRAPAVPLRPEGEGGEKTPTSHTWSFLTVREQPGEAA